MTTIFTVKATNGTETLVKEFCSYYKARTLAKVLESTGYEVHLTRKVVL